MTLKLTVNSLARGTWNCSFLVSELEGKIKEGIHKLGFSLADVNIICNGKYLDLEKLKDVEVRTPLSIYVLMRSQCKSEVTFQIKQPLQRSLGENSCSLPPTPVTVSAGTTVKELKAELCLRGLTNWRKPNAVRLVYRGLTLENHQSVGEYTGTLKACCSTESKGSPRPHQLLVLSSPVHVTDDDADLGVHVALPNGKTINLDVAPWSTVSTLKEVLHRHYRCPPPESFELFCAHRRVPLDAGSAVLSPNNPVVASLHKNQGKGKGEEVPRTPKSPPPHHSSSLEGASPAAVPPRGAEGRSKELTVREAFELVPPEGHLAPMSPSSALERQSAAGCTLSEVEGEEGESSSLKRHLKKKLERDELNVLLVPAVHLNLPPSAREETSGSSSSSRNKTSVLVTTFDMLDALHPPPMGTREKPSEQERAGRGPGASTTFRGAKIGSRVPGCGTTAAGILQPKKASGAKVKHSYPTSSSSSSLSSTSSTSKPNGGGLRPSRPAGHPKERMSKARKTFAGLRRGFFTPEKKNRRRINTCAAGQTPDSPGDSPATSLRPLPPPTSDRSDKEKKQLEPAQITTRTAAAAAAPATTPSKQVGPSSSSSSSPSSPSTPNPLPLSNSATTTPVRTDPPEAVVGLPEECSPTPWKHHSPPTGGLTSPPKLPSSGRRLPPYNGSAGTAADVDAELATCLSSPLPVRRRRALAPPTPPSPAPYPTTPPCPRHHHHQGRSELRRPEEPRGMKDKQQLVPPSQAEITEAAAAAVAAAATTPLPPKPVQLWGSSPGVSPKETSSPDESQQRREAALAKLARRQAPKGSVGEAEGEEALRAKGEEKDDGGLAAAARGGTLEHGGGRGGGGGSRRGTPPASAAAAAGTTHGATTSKLPPKCEACRKKLKLLEVASGGCRCGGQFCSRHSHFATHACPFDFMGQERKHLWESSAGSLAPPKLAFI